MKSSARSRAGIRRHYFVGIAFTNRLLYSKPRSASNADMLYVPEASRILRRSLLVARQID